MAFPTTSILDDFNAGANQLLTARSGWGSGVIVSGDTSYSTDAVPTTAIVSSTVEFSNVWGTTFGPDCEAYYTVSAVSAAGSQQEVWCRVTNAGTTTPTAYVFDCTNAIGQQLYKVVAGVSTALGNLNAVNIAAGDSIGIECIGTAIKGYHKVGAGAWTNVCSATDSAVTGAGSIGPLNLLDATVKIDNFGGGTIGGAVSVTPYRPIMIQQGR